MYLEYTDFEKILKIGIRLSTERDRNQLLETIMEAGMQITHCDASAMYLYEDGQLFFRNMKVNSLGISVDKDSETLKRMPTIPMKEKNACAYTAMHRQVVNVGDIYNSDKFDFSDSKECDMLIGYRTKSMLVIPIENNENELIGVLQLINALDEQRKITEFDKQYELIVLSLGSMAAIELTNLAYVEELKVQLHSFVEALATAIDERTPYNGTHTRKVAEYSALLADYIAKMHKLGLCEEDFDEERKEKLLLAALLHDIGKMIVPLSIMNRATRLDGDIVQLEERFRLLRAYYEIDLLQNRISREEYDRIMQEMDDDLKFIHEIDTMSYLDDDICDHVLAMSKKSHLNEDGTSTPYLTGHETECLTIRRGTLTAADRKLMENHVVMTEKILSKVHFNRSYRDVPKWAAAHHEFLDGCGYPKQLTSDQLDLETRILTVSDIYDALTATDRPYKEPMPQEAALLTLKEMAEDGKIELRLVSWLGQALRERDNPQQEFVQGGIASEADVTDALDIAENSLDTFKEKLDKLVLLKESGLLTEVEFATEKVKLLGLL